MPKLKLKLNLQKINDTKKSQEANKRFNDFYSDLENKENKKPKISFNDKKNTKTEVERNYQKSDFFSKKDLSFEERLEEEALENELSDELKANLQQAQENKKINENSSLKIVKAVKTKSEQQLKAEIIKLKKELEDAKIVFNQQSKKTKSNSLSEEQFNKKQELVLKSMKEYIKQCENSIEDLKLEIKIIAEENLKQKALIPDDATGMNDYLKEYEEQHNPLETKKETEQEQSFTFNSKNFDLIELDSQSLLDHQQPEPSEQIDLWEQPEIFQSDSNEEELGMAI